MDKSLLMFRGGVRSVKKLLADGKEHDLFYKARTPNELAQHFGAANALPNDGDGAVSLQKLRAKFIAASLCTEDGEPLMTIAEAENIPGTLKNEIVLMVSQGSAEIGDAGKG